MYVYIPTSTNEASYTETFDAIEFIGARYDKLVIFVATLI